LLESEIILAKFKYRFNPSTLNFEQISFTVRDYLILGFRYLLAGLVIGGLGVVLYASFFKDPETSRLEREIKFLNQQVESMHGQMDSLDRYADVLQKRDDEIYRTIFAADPPKDRTRKGNNNGFRNLAGYESTEAIIQTKERLSRIENVMVNQSKSYDEILQLVQRQDMMLACLPAIQPVDNKDLKRIASGFGFRIHPIYRVAKMHTGLDFTADIGTEIYATGDGIVKAPSGGSGYGLHIVLDHGFGYQTLYGHMSRMAVRPGEKVKRGQIIGYVGNTGLSSGPHLHYEVIKNGVKVDPAYYFYNDLTPEQYADLLQRAANTGQSFD
jgi:murein DD-endopeptidase MepM/ murein hydrolase activator NlpD